MYHCVLLTFSGRTESVMVGIVPFWCKVVGVSAVGAVGIVPFWYDVVGRFVVGLVSVGRANGAGQSGVDGREEDAEVDVVEVEFGQQVDGHPVGDHPEVVQSVDFHVAGENQRLVVRIDDAQVLWLVRETRVPTPDCVPVDQVEVEYPVVVHVMRCDVSAGSPGVQHYEVVVDFFGREFRVAQDLRGHGELAVAGQRVEEQQSKTVLGDW